MAVLNTSSIPDRDVDREIRALARHVNMDKVVVHMKKLGARRRSYGRAYRHIPSITNMNGLQRYEWRYLIVVTDGHWLSTLAHEAKHVEQFRDRKPISELAASAFAHWFAERRTAPRQ